MTNDTVSKAVKLIDTRLSEIREEETRLLSARKELVREKTPGPRGVRGGRRPERLNEFVTLIKEHPGLKTAEIADKMQIRPNYLYRVANQAVERGLVTKDGVTYTPRS